MIGKRTGNGVSPQLCETLERVCVDAEFLVGKEQAQRRVAVTQEALDEKMDNIRGAVTMGEQNKQVGPTCVGTAALLCNFGVMLSPLFSCAVSARDTHVFVHCFSLWRCGLYSNALM